MPGRAILSPSSLGETQGLQSQATSCRTTSPCVSSRVFLLWMDSGRKQRSLGHGYSVTSLPLPGQNFKLFGLEFRSFHAQDPSQFSSAISRLSS